MRACRKASRTSQTRPAPEAWKGRAAATTWTRLFSPRPRQTVGRGVAGCSTGRPGPAMAGTGHRGQGAAGPASGGTAVAGPGAAGPVGAGRAAVGRAAVGQAAAGRGVAGPG